MVEFVIAMPVLFVMHLGAFVLSDALVSLFALTVQQLHLIQYRPIRNAA